MSSLSEDRISLRDRFKAATRDAILEAAAALLTTDAGTRIRMEDVAARAGIAVGTLYNYFEDRSALVTALLDTRTRTLLEVLDRPAPAGAEGRRGSRDALATELERFVSAVGRHVNTNRFLLHVLIDEERQGRGAARAASRRRTVVEELHTRAEALMARGIRARVLRKGDPATYAALLVGMVRGFATHTLARGDAWAPDAAAQIVRVFLSGAAR